MSFRKLRVYLAAEQLVAEVERLLGIARGVSEEDYGQLNDAAGSVPANIAEACGLGTPGNMRKHLRIARGSCDETQAHLRRFVQKEHLEKDDLKKVIPLGIAVAKMLTSLIDKIEDD